MKVKLGKTKFKIHPIPANHIAGIGDLFSGDPAKRDYALLWNTLAPANESLTAEMLADFLNEATPGEISKAVSEVLAACISGQSDALRDQPLLAPGSRSRSIEALCTWWEWPANFAASLSRQRTA